MFFLFFPDADECSFSICANGACNNTVRSFNCVCKAGYTGRRCDRRSGMPTAGMHTPMTNSTIVGYIAPSIIAVAFILFVALFLYSRCAYPKNCKFQANDDVHSTRTNAVNTGGVLNSHARPQHMLDNISDAIPYEEVLATHVSSLSLPAGSADSSRMTDSEAYNIQHTVPPFTVSVNSDSHPVTTCDVCGLSKHDRNQLYCPSVII